MREVSGKAYLTSKGKFLDQGRKVPFGLVVAFQANAGHYSSNDATSTTLRQSPFVVISTLQNASVQLK